MRKLFSAKKLWFLRDKLLNTVNESDNLQMFQDNLERALEKADKNHNKRLLALSVLLYNNQPLIEELLKVGRLSTQYSIATKEFKNSRVA